MCLITGQPRALAGAVLVSCPFPVKAAGEIKLSPNQLGIWREACERCGLGAAASVAWGLSCGHRSPLGSDNSLAKLQLSPWVSAQPWNGYWLQGRTFSPLGQRSARTPRVFQQWLDWKGGKKENKNRGHEVSCAAARDTPPVRLRVCCVRRRKGLSSFFRFFSCISPCSLNSYWNGNPGFGRQVFLQWSRQPLDFQWLWFIWDPRATFEDLVWFLTF